MGRAAAARRALRARRRRAPRLPAESARRRVDFESDAALVADISCPATTSSATRTAVSIALLAAARRPELIRSLRSSSLPPRGSRSAILPSTASPREGAELYASGATDEPEAFLRRFLAAVGSAFDPPSPLPPELEQGAQSAGRRARPVGGRDPARRARGGAVPEARRLRRAPSGLRRDLRRPRARARAPSAPCSPATATPSSAIRTSTTSSPTSSSAPRREADGRTTRAWSRDAKAQVTSCHLRRSRHALVHEARRPTGAPSWRACTRPLRASTGDFVETIVRLDDPSVPIAELVPANSVNVLHNWTFRARATNASASSSTQRGANARRRRANRRDAHPRRPVPRWSRRTESTRPRREAFARDKLQRAALRNRCVCRASGAASAPGGSLAAEALQALMRSRSSCSRSRRRTRGFASFTISSRYTT